MRLNFTGRRDIEKHDARVTFNDDPVGSKGGYYFELSLELDEYKFPPEARVFVEAFRGPLLMRFDLGTVGALRSLSPSERRLSEFAPSPDGVRVRVKVVRPDGPEAGKLLADADNLTPGGGGGVFPLIELAGDDMGSTPWRLDHVPSDSALPTLYIHTALGGKEYAKDPAAKPLLMTAAAREILATLIAQDDNHEEEPNHWACLWTRFVTEVLGLGEPPHSDAGDEETRSWIDTAVDAFAAKLDLVNNLANWKASIELLELEELN